MAPDCDARASPPAGGSTGEKGGGQPNLGIGAQEAETVRPDEPDSVTSGDPDQLRLALAASLAGLTEAGRDNHRGAHAGGSGVGQYIRDRGRWNGDDREIDRLRYRRQGRNEGHRGIVVVCGLTA
jgi:hypothetical protein